MQQTRFVDGMVMTKLEAGFCGKMSPFNMIYTCICILLLLLCESILPPTPLFIHNTHNIIIYPLSPSFIIYILSHQALYEVFQRFISIPPSSLFHPPPTQTPWQTGWFLKAPFPSYWDCLTTTCRPEGDDWCCWCWCWVVMVVLYGMEQKKQREKNGNWVKFDQQWWTTQQTNQLEVEWIKCRANQLYWTSPSFVATRRLSIGRWHSANLQIDINVY